MEDSLRHALACETEANRGNRTFVPIEARCLQLPKEGEFLSSWR